MPTKLLKATFYLPLKDNKTFKAKTQQEAIYLEIEHDVDVRFL